MNTPLQQAAQELLDRWDSTYWKDQRATSEYVNALRVALEAEQAQAVDAMKATPEDMLIYRNIAKQAQAAEPIGYVYSVPTNPGEKSAAIPADIPNGTPLYLHPAPPYDQQALELCDACGWKAIMPGEPCFACNMQASAQQVAVPMTEDEIEAACRFIEPSLDGPIAYDLLIARAIEAHHGIGSKLVTKPDSRPEPTDWSAA